tara:strand:+ start:170 stop:517 length:348 start_codon:yes stop_codon:yes gene_type:complete
MYIFLKIFITALIIVTVSEIAKKYTWAAAIIVSLPLTSLLAFMWLYYDTKDVQKIIDLSLSTIVMTIPSFLFFIILPTMLKLKLNFTFSIFVSILVTSLGYLIFMVLIKKLNFNF